MYDVAVILAFSLDFGFVALSLVDGTTRTLKNAAGSDSVLQHVADRRTDTAVPCHVGTGTVTASL